MIIQEISKKLELPLDYNVCQDKRLRPITLEKMLQTLISQNTLKNACVELGISRSSLTDICKSIFPEKNSKQYWSTYLYSLVASRKCSKCEKVLNTEFFRNYGSMCEQCLYSYGSNKYFANKDQHRDWNRNWRKNNPHKAAESSAKRRSNKLNQTPEDADLKLIEYIYMHCPPGWHVDHIIPLSKGGLHHQDNLCYLWELDNLSKKDKMPEDVPEIMERAIFPLYKDGGFL